MKLFFVRKRPARAKLAAAVAEILESRRLLSSSTWVTVMADGRLSYTPTSTGDHIEDFSQVGYDTGDVALPDATGGVSVPVKITLSPSTSDMTTTIQNAINSVSAMTMDANGFRGAIQFLAGNYPISGQLNINASGVVLIGAGNNATTGTRLEATGTSTRFLLNINGSGSASTVSNTTHNIEGYMPVGATSFTVDSTSNLHVGDTVIINRPSTANWIHDIGMDTLTIPWTAGSKDQNSDRVITAISGTTITIDAPLTNSLDPQYGGGTIHRYTWSGRISQVGVMNMYTYSDYTGSTTGGTDTDTTHAGGVLTMDSVSNAWIENITADNYSLNDIEVGNGAKWVTFNQLTIQNTSQAQSNIDDAPAGFGSSGEEILLENSTFTNAYHAIALGASFAGPSVYTNIVITDPDEGALGLPHSRDETGPHQRWSTGGLFDNVSDTDWINIRNAGDEGTGHGWQGANYVLWNVNARTDVSSPPTAQNWVIGGTGSTSEGTAIYDQRGTTVLPTSLYATQLWDRMHADPTVATAASANPNPLGTSKSVNLSVLGASSVGESNLTYTWATTSQPSGASNPTFSVNGTNSAKNTVVTLSTVGTYIFVVTIQDPGGLKVTSTVIVTPNTATVINGDQDVANENDTFRIVRNGTFVDVYRNSTTTPAVHQDYASSPELAILADGGNDTITVDYSGGDPIPANGLIIDGGAANDIVSVVGSSGNDAITLSGGNVNINGGSFGYTNIEELDLAPGAGNDTLTAVGDTSVSASAFRLNLANAGTLSMSASSTLPTFTDLTDTGATFNVNGQNQTIDALNGTGTITNNGATGATLTVGQFNSDGSFGGNLSNGSTSSLALTKAGTGTLTLTGANSYTGSTFIDGGAVASGNSASLAGLSGTLFFNGGTFHVTGNTISANVNVKYSTSFTGASSASTGEFDIDPGVTLTAGTVNGSTCLRTNGGGSHGGDFTVTGGGTLKILSNNGQQDNVLHLVQGTIDLEAATGLGGGDAGVSLAMSDGTTLILRQDASTNFLTPISAATVGATINLVIDRQTSGPGVTHDLNALTSAGTFTMNVSLGSNVTSGTAGLTLGTVTLSGAGTLNVTNSTPGVALLSITGAVSGSFGVTKSGSGEMSLSGTNTYTGATTVSAGTLIVTAPAIPVANGVVVNAGTYEMTGSTALFKPATLTLNGSSSAVLDSNGSHVLDVTALTIASSAKLDLNDNGLIVDYTGTSPLPTIFGYLKSAFNVGAWNGNGIDSTTAHNDATMLHGIGYAEASTLDTTTFMGQMVDATSVLVRYTAYGDSNLDGTVDIGNDFTLFLDGLAATSGSSWVQGDYTYDNKVDLGNDFNLFLRAYLSGGKAPAAMGMEAATDNGTASVGANKSAMTNDAQGQLAQQVAAVSSVNLFSLQPIGSMSLDDPPLDF